MPTASSSLRASRAATLFALLLLLLPAIAHAYWSDLGLSGRDVRRLRSSHGWLYACTTDGVYRKVSDTADSAWVLLGVSGQRVHDVLAMSTEMLLVARQITGIGADTVALWRSMDGGATWSPFQNGLGADGSVSRKVTALLQPTGSAGAVLAATENGIAKSVNGGDTWYRVRQGGRYFFLAAGISTLWAGGEGSTFGPIIRRSKDGGESWLFSPQPVPGDDKAVTMAFDPSDPNVAYLGLETYGLSRTLDDGLSWASVPLPAGVYSTALGNRAFPPLRLYASGDAAPAGATLFKNDDAGGSWTSVSFAAAGSSSERTLLVRSGPATDTIFVGMGSGVLRYVELEVLAAGAPPKSSQVELRAHPNPLRERTTLMFRLPRASHVLLRILDLAGREVATIIDADAEAGLHGAMWAPGRIPSGTYFGHLQAGGESATCKLFVTR